MRVRFVGDPGRTASGERRGSGFLTVGKEYVVLALNANNERGVTFLLLDDDTAQPGWHSSVAFDLVADGVPSNWRVSVGGAGKADHLEVGPSAWLEDGFFNNYWGDGDEATIAARQTFQAELEIIIRES